MLELRTFILALSYLAVALTWSCCHAPTIASARIKHLRFSCCFCRLNPTHRSSSLCVQVAVFTHSASWHRGCNGYGKGDAFKSECEPS